MFVPNQLHHHTSTPQQPAQIFFEGQTERTDWLSWAVWVFSCIPAVILAVVEEPLVLLYIPVSFVALLFWLWIWSDPANEFCESCITVDPSEKMLYYRLTAKDDRFSTSQCFALEDVYGLQARTNQIGASHTFQHGDHRSSGQTRFHYQTMAAIVFTTGVEIPVRLSETNDPAALQPSLSYINKYINFARQYVATPRQPFVMSEGKEVSVNVNNSVDQCQS
ncbi:hypothetical protein P9112_009828 [Eukaryota sp. TZLM1-RC]